MFHLILKDFKFTLKWLIAAVLYGIIVSAFMISENESLFFTFFLIPFVVVSFPLGKILNMEDNENTRAFLKCLPYSALQMVIARVLFVIILLVFSLTCLGTAESLINGIEDRYAYIVKVVLFFEAFFAYFMVYLSLYYKKSFYAAQNCVAACVIIVMAFFFIMKKIPFSIEFLQTQIYQWGIFLLGIVDIALFGVTYLCARQSNLE